jgi:hypothetical protein
VLSVAEKFPDLIETFSRSFSVPPRQYPDVWASNVSVTGNVSEFYDPSASPYFVVWLRAIFDNTLKAICVAAPPGCG